MAIEPRRGCGYRKVGGLYLVADEGGWTCDRLPLELSICPCCGEGIKQTRGWRWIDPLKLFGPSEHQPCACPPACPICNPSEHFEDAKAGILWVGAGYYPTPQDFLKEGAQLGLSRRISTLPTGFKVGETWVFLGHPKAVTRQCDPLTSGADGPDVENWPGIFCVFRPQRIERIVLTSELAVFREIVRIEMKAFSEFEFDADKIRARQVERFGEEGMEIYRRLQLDINRGISLVPVPNDDPDHRGRNVPGKIKEEEDDE